LLKIGGFLIEDYLNYSLNFVSVAKIYKTFTTLSIIAFYWILKCELTNLVRLFFIQ